VIVWPTARPVTDKSLLRLECNEAAGDEDQELLKVKWRRLRAVGHCAVTAGTGIIVSTQTMQTSCVQSLVDSLRPVLTSRSRLSAPQCF
jgi:hypothetical protein